MSPRPAVPGAAHAGRDGVDPQPTVLVLRALGVGDLLTAVPALRGLRAAHPDHRIALAAPAALRGLAQLTGAVDDLLPTAATPTGPGPIGADTDTDTEAADSRAADTEAIDSGATADAARAPDLAVNLHGSGPQSIHALLATAPRRLITHAHPDVPGVDGPPWDPDVHEVHRWCRLLANHGIPADPTDLAVDRPRTPSPAPGAVVVHPGASHAARRWPPDRYAQVARRIADLGSTLVITGDAADRPLAEHVADAAGLPPHRVLAGRTTLTELAALVADATLVVCGDTGVAHLATAYGTPSVILFGPVPPHLWGPPPDRDQHVSLWSGHTGDTFAPNPDQGLLRIPISDVVTAARRIAPLRTSA